MKAAHFTLTLGVLAALAGCGNPPAAKPADAPKPVAPVASPVQPAAARPAQAMAIVPKPDLPPAVASPATYAPKGRRDPFETLETSTGSAASIVASAKLTGIVRERGTVMALVETSDGLGYILKPGDTLGNGRLLEIGPDTAVFSVPLRAGSPSNRVVLRMASD